MQSRKKQLSDITYSKSEVTNCQLTPEEASHVLSVMIRAKCFNAANEAQEFDAQESVQQLKPIEGQLSKYTNVVKGWQFRWFVVNPSRGTLEYYMPEERKKTHPRGCIYLAGCVVSPSEEDSQTFIVSAACGEVYKLKAADAKERQFWVNKLRQVALAQENRIAAQHPPIGSASSSSLSLSPRDLVASSASLEAVRDVLLQTQKYQRNLNDIIETNTCNDEQLLLLKATSQATLIVLEQCFTILQSLQHR